MRKYAFSAVILGGLFTAGAVFAAVTVDSGPTSLVTSATTLKATSSPLALFKFTLGVTEVETLSQVKVIVNDNWSSGVTEGDIASLAVYKDEGNGVFDSGTDLFVGSQTTVNIGSTTTVNTTSNNSIATSSMFFVTMATSDTWSGVAPADSVIVTLPTLGIETSQNSPTSTPVTTAAITAPLVQTGDEDDDDAIKPVKCDNGLVNGKLYKEQSSETVYLAAACRLKPFRGAAVFHARGKKFQEVNVVPDVDAYPISQKPVLPASGTLVKGSDATIWMVTKNQHRRGFKTAEKFHSLGFQFWQVHNISDADLNLLAIDNPIGDNESFPDGALFKCGASATVYEVVGNKKHAFRNAAAFLNRGHAWQHVAQIGTCNLFQYQEGAPIEE